MPQVRLTTLPVLRRYSLALRQEWADAETLLQTLEESITAVQKSLEGSHREVHTRAAGSPPHRDEPKAEEQ
ncbi:MAG TPA: hypothetical protein VMY88_02640 [Acidimicrobiales bacterium]|nr:hypothetical protein [Acidimicrobiales bacterium]